MLSIGDTGAPRRSFPLATYALIAANVLMFLAELNGGDAFILKWAFIPNRFQAHPAQYWQTIFTALFLHASWIHLGGNMLFLWVFGDNVEDRFGKIPFLAFYFLCGIAATFTQTAFELGSTTPNLGASGAIAGVLGAYFLLFPRVKVDLLLFFFVVEVPALIVIGLWIILQLFNGLGAVSASANTGGVAYMAHVGGDLSRDWC
jgi:membrane associated rhomboid family serine protease